MMGSVSARMVKGRGRGGEGGRGGGTLQMRNPRKKRRVMGWELRRQCRSPCFGCCWVRLSIEMGGWVGEGVTY